MKEKKQEIIKKLDLMSNNIDCMNNISCEYLKDLKIGVSSTIKLLSRIEEKLDCCIASVDVIKDGFEAVHSDIKDIIDS